VVVLADVDFVVLAVPLVADTRGLVGDTAYRWAKIADNLRRLQTGEPRLNVVKPAITP